MITSYFVKKCPHFLPKMYSSIACILPGFCHSVRMYTHICEVVCQNLLRCPWSRQTPGSLFSPLFLLALPSPVVQWLSPSCFYIHAFPVVWFSVLLYLNMESEKEENQSDHAIHISDPLFSELLEYSRGRKKWLFFRVKKSITKSSLE